MLVALFGFLLGFSIAATLIGLISNWSLLDRVVIIFLLVVALLAALFDPRFYGLPPTGIIQKLILDAVFTQTVWVLLGASLAILSMMWREGLFENLLRPWRDLFGLTPKRPTVGALGARDELFAKLCLYAFQNGRRAILTDLETVLRAGVGHRQQALHAIAAPGVRGHAKFEPIRLIHQYQTHFDPILSGAPVIYAMLCRMAMITESNTAATTKRLHKIGHALELDRGQMNEALSGA